MVLEAALLFMEGDGGRLLHGTTQHLVEHDEALRNEVEPRPEVDAHSVAAAISPDHIVEHLGDHRFAVHRLAAQQKVDQSNLPLGTPAHCDGLEVQRQRVKCPPSQSSPCSMVSVHCSTMKRGDRKRKRRRLRWSLCVEKRRLSSAKVMAMGSGAEI